MAPSFIASSCEMHHFQTVCLPKRIQVLAKAVKPVNYSPMWGLATSADLWQGCLLKIGAKCWRECQTVGVVEVRRRHDSYFMTGFIQSRWDFNSKRVVTGICVLGKLYEQVAQCDKICGLLQRRENFADSPPWHFLEELSKSPFVSATFCSVSYLFHIFLKGVEAIRNNFVSLNTNTFSSMAGKTKVCL